MSKQNILIPFSSPHKQHLLYEGLHLKLQQRNGWEYVTRRNLSGIVAVLAVTLDEKILLVEQYRPPLHCNVIEIPSGLVGDIAGSENEAFAEAAQRELFEETGYRADSMEKLMEGPVSAGLSTEIITFFCASGLKKEGIGGGDSTENIRLHEVPLNNINDWLNKRQHEGILIDCKIYAALFFEVQRRQIQKGLFYSS